MTQKYYAVKAGKKTGIFTSWEECRESVHGYPCAVYKSFKTREEALAYLEKNDFVEKDGLNDKSRVKIYVDGSYDQATGEFSYGMVALTGEQEEHFCRKFQDPELALMRNVAGEIKGAQAAMQYALDRKIGAIDIYHDYEGIARWCLGEWKTNKEGTRAYKEFFDRAARQVDIRFVKVAGHSGDKYNDMADELAKKALGLA